MIAGNTYAVTCPAGKVQMVYPTDTKVYIQLEGQAWHVLGMKKDMDINQKLAKAMMAQQNQREINWGKSKVGCDSEP